MLGRPRKGDKVIACSRTQTTAEETYMYAKCMFAVQQTVTYLQAEYFKIRIIPTFLMRASAPERYDLSSPNLRI
jgi:hypothetical protein